MKPIFVYLTAILDWHSRFIVGWELDDTLSSAMVECALENAFAVANQILRKSVDAELN